ncbi:branched-chain amino acid ABC transporter substrate-binding protein [Mesorhizobium sp. URHB0026]
MSTVEKLLFSAIGLAALIAFSGSAGADILIGVAGPITGPNAAFGAQLQKGAEQAAADINAAGGINGQLIKLEVGDDVSDPKQGISVANKFIGDGVKYVIGHFNSGVTIPASDVYAENGILVITPSATNPSLTERGMWNTFRTCPRDDQRGMVAGAYIAANYKGAKIAIVHDKRSYGQNLADQTKNAIHAAGIADAMYEDIDVAGGDFSTLASKMTNAGVSVVYFDGDPNDSEVFAQKIGPDVQAILTTYIPDPRSIPGAKELVEKFRAAGFEPEAYTLYSYAALQIVAAAAAKVGSADDAQKVAEAIKADGPWKTAIGDIGYDAKGDVTLSEFGVYEVAKDGCPQCPKSGACPQAITDTPKCDCPKSGACPQ